MLAIMLIALLFDRAAITLRNLAIAAIVVLVVSPHEVVGPSFQMSFAATAALIAAYAWWAERGRRGRSAQPPSDMSRMGQIVRTGGRYVLGLAMTSLIAGIATTVYGAWHFQRVSPLSLAANLAAMPIVSIAVMPPAVLAMVAMPFGLDGPFLDIMGKGLALMTAVAEWFSARSPIDAVGEVPLSAVVAATVALVVATLATTWLKALALPFVAFAALQFATHTLPDVLVAEDGRLVAVPTGDGLLAVNRKRPNSFAIEDWKRTMRADGVVGPVAASHVADAQVIGAPEADFATADVAAFPSSDDRHQTTDNSLAVGNPVSGRTEHLQGIEEHSATDDRVSGSLKQLQAAKDDQAAEDRISVAARQVLATKDVRAPGNRFLCDDRLCAVRTSTGVIVVTTADAGAAREHCRKAQLIVLTDATADIACATDAATVVTLRELALRGSMAFRTVRDGQRGWASTIAHAVDLPLRPWHQHRRVSRAARGLPPWEPKRTP